MKAVAWVFIGVASVVAFLAMSFPAVGIGFANSKSVTDTGDSLIGAYKWTCFIVFYLWSLTLIGCVRKGRIESDKAVGTNHNFWYLLVVSCLFTWVTFNKCWDVVALRMDPTYLPSANEFLVSMWPLFTATLVLLIVLARELKN